MNSAMICNDTTIFSQIIL